MDKKKYNKLTIGVAGDIILAVVSISLLLLSFGMLVPFLIYVAIIILMLYLVIKAPFSYHNLSKAKSEFKSKKTYMMTKLALLVAVIYSIIHSILIIMCIVDPIRNLQLSTEIMLGTVRTLSTEGDPMGLVAWTSGTTFNRVLQFIDSILTGKGLINALPVLVSFIVIMVVHYFTKKSKLSTHQE